MEPFCKQFARPLTAYVAVNTFILSGANLHSSRAVLQENHFMYTHLYSRLCKGWIIT